MDLFENLKKDSSEAYIKRTLFPGQILKLSALGFTTEDCTKALKICSGKLDDAALWLTQNAAHVARDKETSSDSDSRSAISFETVEVKIILLSLWVSVLTK